MCQGCDWETFLETIEEIMDDHAYEFASDTIGGIYDTVQERKHCTDGQKKAIANIKKSQRKRGDLWD